LLLLDR